MKEKNRIIGACAVIVAAIITGLFSICKKESPINVVIPPPVPDDNRTLADWEKNIKGYPAYIAKCNEVKAWQDSTRDLRAILTELNDANKSVDDFKNATK